ncbi:MAG: pyruvate, phosphate dikinase [Desulfobacteraceae bacterium]|nr:pyruvate, phosphate dikinase [Desulfobacteraceae bacterium]MBU4054073.1 pyruvate, phosphate dikinase [Pseudomonadota bacterium]
MKKKWVYLFSELDEIEKIVNGDFDRVRGLMGGKGAGLAKMANLGIPVPPGFTVTSEACNAYLKLGGAFPEDMWEQEKNAVKHLESITGKKFGGPDNPLLVSCRSGAKFSMPGMMDTVLNIGLNDEIALELIALTGDERFVYDTYRRLIQMFGHVVMGIPDDVFENKIQEAKVAARVQTDAELKAEDWKHLTSEFKRLYKRHTNHDFPTDPYAQLRMGTEAVFESWNGKRAVDYRNASGIPHDMGTAVNIVTMVFGNIGDKSASGVAMTRNSSTGEKKIEGDYLINAQGEDVVAGIRMTDDIAHLKDQMPEVWKQFNEIGQKLEAHFRDMQDVEFTIEDAKLWVLQTRNGKRSAQAAVRIAVDMVDEGLITQEEAVERITPDQVDFFMHPQFGRSIKQRAREQKLWLASGLNVSPGAAVGMVAFDADLTETWAKKQNKQVIMVRTETKPDDVHGMLASKGILTSRGGRTSHAALVARQFGKPAVVGVSSMEIDMNKRQMTINQNVVKEGDWISIDGTDGEVYLGKLETSVLDIDNPWLIKLLSWADQIRRLKVWTNADYPVDAQRARAYGAEGIGLCRTEHMFFEPQRLPFLNKMIMAKLPVDRQEALDALLPFQREDFAGLFRAMEGYPVVTRLIDPPLHEFLPSHKEVIYELTDLKIRIKSASNLEEVDTILKQIREKTDILDRVESLWESNPMLGMRGVRLGILIPELTMMQVRAIFEAACIVIKEGIEVHPKIMIPLTSHVNELKIQRGLLEVEARKVMNEQDMEIDYEFGTMIEIPRAALTADQLAEYASFFSFGTNDLTQTTFGISRDDAEGGFLINYIAAGILPENPFATIDKEGVGKLMAIAVEKGRSVNPDLECGICGEHGGDPKSIAFCHQIGLTYVSCSPFRVPIARLAAAHAAIAEKKNQGKS